MLDDGGRALYQATEEVGAGAHRFEWDLLLDEELALAAEKERVENAAGDKKDRSGKRRERDKAKDDDDKTGEATLATTPWAEAVRLERPLYVTPGKYTVRVSAGDETAETSLEVEEPEKREPRVPEKPKIRGRK